MAHRQGVGQGEPSQDGHWPAASNDHYCPSETACRHAVIDISSADTVPSEASEEHQRLRQLSRSNDRYYPEGTDYHAFGRRRRSTSYDYTRPSLSGYVPSQEEDIGIENLPWNKPSRSRSASPTSYGPETSHKLSAATHAGEEAKITRACMKQLTHDSINTRTRLAYLESHVLSNTDRLAGRCDGLTEVCTLFNRQYKLLLGQYDSLLAMVQDQGNELRLLTDRQVGASKLKGNELRLLSDGQVGAAKLEGCESSRRVDRKSFSVPTPDSAIYMSMSDSDEQSDHQTRQAKAPLIISVGKKRGAGSQGGRASKAAKQRRR